MNRYLVTIDYQTDCGQPGFWRGEVWAQDNARACVKGEQNAAKERRRLYEITAAEAELIAAPMTLAEAESIVGRSNACEPWLSNMIKALRSMPWLNSDDENKRLAAAELIKASRRKGRRA
jgi:hypothetical protein